MVHHKQRLRSCPSEFGGCKPQAIADGLESGRALHGLHPMGVLWVIWISSCQWAAGVKWWGMWDSWLGLGVVPQVLTPPPAWAIEAGKGKARPLWPSGRAMELQTCDGAVRKNG